MTQARKNQINAADTPYYHCISRCVRRAYLCGTDKNEGKDYSHRKQWIIERLELIAIVYTIDICSYAIMDNHYHLVLKINKEKEASLSDDEVIERWMILFSGNVLINRFINGQCKIQAEIDKCQEIIDLWRTRLTDISWFMRSINEYISRKSNEEDKCTGHFWEGRFKSQALLNEQAVLSCMAYVDLNPIRAGMNDSLDSSEFTSIEQRVKQFSVDSIQLAEKSEKKIQGVGCVPLADFVGGKQLDGIPYTLIDYLELVDWTGRAIRDDVGKRGYIPKSEPKILNKLGITAEIWLDTVDEYNKGFHQFIGSEPELKEVCESLNIKWLSGIKKSRQLFLS
jgi:putative transposase